MEIKFKKSTDNWMFDEVKETCEKELNQEELITKLAIQKIEYGRTCIAQFLTMTSGKSEKDAEEYYNHFDSELKKRIEELKSK